MFKLHKTARANQIPLMLEATMVTSPRQATTSCRELKALTLAIYLQMILTFWKLNVTN
jgi:hypothetical protein